VRKRKARSRDRAEKPAAGGAAWRTTVNTKRNEYNTEGAGFQGDARPAFLDPTQWREVRKGKWQHKTAGGVHFTLHRKGVKGSKNAEWTLDCQDPGESERRAYELGTYASLEELLRDEADTLVKRAGAGAATAAAAPLENGAEILDAMVAEIRKHIILEQHFAEAIALWIFHAHSIERIASAHAFTSSLPSGVVARARYWKSSNISVARASVLFWSAT
jgi:hypothetical protein